MILPKKTYTAAVWGAVSVVQPDGPGYMLEPRLDLRAHSPTGFSWGYSGSGPAQLALAILADHFKTTAGGEGRALRLYQRFKEIAIAGRPGDQPFRMGTLEVCGYIAKIEGGL